MNRGVTVAIVGDFQRGKSTLVNALLGRNATKTGRGLSMTRTNRAFPLTPQVRIVDTPGFNANRKDTQTALVALKNADVFLYVHENKELGDAHEELFKMARENGKSILFLLNCLNFAKWAPEKNGDVIDTIEAELSNKGIVRNLLSFGTRLVLPINALWASFGEGLLNPCLAEDQSDMEAIRHYAVKQLKIPGSTSMSEKSLRKEMLLRSGVLEVRNWLMELPILRLRNVLENPVRTLDRICDQFAVELKKRWMTA